METYTIPGGNFILGDWTASKASQAGEENKCSRFQVLHGWNEQLYRWEVYFIAYL